MVSAIKLIVFNQIKCSVLFTIVELKCHTWFFSLSSIVRNKVIYLILQRPFFWNQLFEWLWWKLIYLSVLKKTILNRTMRQRQTLLFFIYLYNKLWICLVIQISMALDIEMLTANTNLGRVQCIKAACNRWKMCHFKMHSKNVYNPHKHRNKLFHSQIPNSVERKKEEHSDEKTLSIDDEIKTVRITCQENFNQYLMNTTLHGLRYVGDRSITLFER